MKRIALRSLVLVAATGVLAVVGCRQKSGAETPKGDMERAGAALNQATEKTVQLATNVAAHAQAVAEEAGQAAKDAAKQAVEKTGEVVEKAGAAVEKTGADMQK